MKAAEYVIEREKFLLVVLQQKFAKSVVQEAVRMKPHFDRLNMGKGGQGRKIESLRNLAYMQDRRERSGDLELSSKEVFKWLELKDSPFKLFLTLFGGGGMYFNAEVFVVSMQAGWGSFCIYCSFRLPCFIGFDFVVRRMCGY